MGETLQFAPTDCFANFPFPSKDVVARVGKEYPSFRWKLLHEKEEGLTTIYNRFHDPDETDTGIQKLRQLHVEMDKAVAVAYDWTDLDLGHGFHETKQGLRFPISETARREVLGRLLKLNHERYAEEVARGLHDKKGKAKGSGGKRRRASKQQPGESFLNFGNSEGKKPE